MWTFNHKSLSWGRDHIRWGSGKDNIIVGEIYRVPTNEQLSIQRYENIFTKTNTF